MKKIYISVLTLVFIFIGVVLLSSSNNKEILRANAYVSNKILLQSENIEISKNESTDILVLESGSFTFESSDENIVEVDSKGTITAKNGGTATIYITDSNNRKANCKVNVSILAESVELDDETITVSLDDEVNLSATISPDDTTDKSLIWESSDSDIAEVDKDGKVSLKKSGNVKITVKTKNEKSDEITINIKNNTYDKTAIFFGDSITEGTKGTPKGYSWANYIGDHYDLKSTVNAGKSGWLISNALKKKWINSVVKSYKNKEYDYVILHGGVNDIHQEVELGTYEDDDFSGNYDISTFLGGLETYIYTAKKQWPNAKIGYIVNYATPLKHPELNDLYPDYYSSMMKVLDKWQIKYIDLYSGSTLDGTKYSDLLKVDTQDYLIDDLHLNADGYELISQYIYEWMNTL